DKPQGDGVVGIAVLLAQPGERFPDTRTAIVKHRRRVSSKAAAMRHKARHQTALSVELVRIRAGETHRLGPGIARRSSRISLIEPDAIEKLHQREIQDIDPD